MFDNCIIFINDIVNKEGKIMTYKQFINIYGNVCPLQKFNQLIVALPQQWKREIRKGNGQELVCRPHIKNYNWLKKRKYKSRNL